MPAKTKKPTRSVRSSRTTSKKKASSLSTSSKLFSTRRFWIIAAVLVAVGSFALFRANAATTTPGGKAAWQRFPGDPNPKVTKKAYIGADELEGTTFKSRFEDPTGKSMSLTRRFYGNFAARSDSGSLSTVNNAASEAKEDIEANRLPLYSFKTPGWSGVANGQHDAALDELLRKLDAAGGPVWLVIHHEPDGGCNDDCRGPNKEDDPAGAPGWVAMQKRVRERMNALGTKNIAFMAVMTGGFSETSVSKGLSMDSWWADNVWDAYMIDYYKDTHDRPMASHPYWTKFVNWIEKKNNGAGLPYGTAELGNRAAGAKGQGYYKPVGDLNGEDGAADYNDCVIQQTRRGGLEPAGVPTATVQKSTDMLREFWNWGFDNNKDVIAHTYFDKCVNSAGSPWALGGQQLDLWRDILKNDQRVMRINDTPNITPVNPVDPSDPVDPGTGGNTGSLSINITSPKAGETVKGVVPVNAGPSTNVQEVSFRLNGKWQTTDNTAPFEWNWNSATLPDGEHTLTIRARKVGDPGGTYTERSVKVRVANKTSTPAPTDLLKPSAPSAVTAALRFDVTRLRYVVDLSWAQSRDDVSGVKQYQVVRDFTILGNTPQPTNSTARVKYTDGTALETGKIYRYTVTAIDGVPRTSDPTTISIQSSCTLVFCSLKQL